MMTNYKRQRGILYIETHPELKHFGCQEKLGMKKQIEFKRAPEREREIIFKTKNVPIFIFLHLKFNCEFQHVKDWRDRLCGLVVRVLGYRTEMYCASCEVRTEFIYVM
jgi:hypothetical protein